MGRVRSERGHVRPAWRGAVLGSGPRLVLVHGGPGLDHHVLLPLAEQLAAHFEVWLPDLAGHGAEPEGGNPTLARVHRELARAVAAFGGAELVVGHSLGAWLVREGLRSGAIQPRSGAVLLAPPAGGVPRVRSKQRQEDPTTLTQSLLDQVRHETGRPPSARFAQCLELATLRPVDAYSRLSDPVADALAKPLQRVRPEVDVLVIAGEADTVVSPHQASEVAHATARTTLITLSGVGHYPAATGEDNVAAAIVEGAGRSTG